MPFTPADPDFVRRVRDNFARQRVMQTFGAELTRVEPGEVEIVLPFRADLTQQHGFLHAGVVITIIDSAVGYAASVACGRPGFYLSTAIRPSSARSFRP